MTATANKNGRVAIAVVCVVAGMVALSFAAVPLYNLFCKVTGYGGTTQRVELANDQVIDRDVTVRFAASVNQNMPWEFHPSQNKQTMKMGEQRIAYYEAYNPTDKTIVGTATFNVTPFKAGSYFAKIDCFCFTEQTLKPGERVEMPVVYYVDPSMDEDRNLDEVSEVTLSYTFFTKEVSDETGKAALNKTAR